MMKGMRGRFLGKLKSISGITSTSLKQSLFFQDNDFSSHQYEFETPILVTTADHTNNNNIEETTLVSSSKNTEKHSTNLLVEFEEKCPPGGNDRVIFYTTSLRGIRKTYEDCNTIRFLLGSFRVVYDERDVSMHLEFREELWDTLGGRVIPPRLFIKGRLIGGVDEVMGLHEEGKLQDLLSGIPKTPPGPCKGCGGMRFLLCVTCNGSRKVIPEEQADDPLLLPISCVECNENGLVKCPVCF